MTITRGEAINILKNTDTAWLGTKKDREETEQAIDMAIEALEENHCEECLFFGLFHRCKECGRVNVIYDDKFEMGDTE